MKSCIVLFYAACYCVRLFSGSVHRFSVATQARENGNRCFSAPVLLILQLHHSPGRVVVDSAQTFVSHALALLPAIAVSPSSSSYRLPNHAMHAHNPPIFLTKLVLQVFVMAQRWGDFYFHFVSEALPRITLMLDVLRNNLDIKVPLFCPTTNSSCRCLESYQYVAVAAVVDGSLYRELI